LSSSRTARTVVARALLMTVTMLGLGLSCTRMPTAPRAGVELGGRVTGPSGEPLPRTLLSFTPEDLALDYFAHAITDSSGAYSVRLLSGTYSVQLVPPAGLMSRTEKITVSAGHSRADFPFRGYRVSGTVIDPAGSVLDSGFVYAFTGRNGQAISRLQAGRYSLVLPAGRYSFFAGPADYWSGFSPLRKDPVAVAGDTTIDFHLSGTPVTGRVTGPDGRPLNDAGVVARGDVSVKNRTAADGTYRLYVPPGSYRVFFYPPFPYYIIPRVVGPLALTAPASIDGDLSGVEWTGVVLRSDTSEPVPELTVLVRMIDDPDGRSAAIQSGSQGEFRFIMEANRRYDLFVFDSSMSLEVAKVQGVTATSDTTFEIRIPPAAL
jgi:hypothetical protein